MREIKFRGMRLGGEWAFGLLCRPRFGGDAQGDSYISNSAGKPMAFEVRPETVGQFTGLKDKNGVEIYEGDIVTHPNPKCFGPVKFGSYNFSDYDFSETGTGFYIDRVDQHVQGLADFVAKSVVIIGNIYENPELLDSLEQEAKETK